METAQQQMNDWFTCETWHWIVSQSIVYCRMSNCVTIAFLSLLLLICPLLLRSAISHWRPHGRKHHLVRLIAFYVSLPSLILWDFCWWLCLSTVFQFFSKSHFKNFTLHRRKIYPTLACCSFKLHGLILIILAVVCKFFKHHMPVPLLMHFRFY